MGYYLDEYPKLIDAIIKGTKFEKIYRINNFEHGLTFCTETKIYNYVKKRYDIICTVWEVKNNKFKFVSLKGKLE